MPSTSSGLSVFFATLCIIDLFGVFPIVALPKAIIDCGWVGIPLALCLLGVQVYTAVLLGRCWLLAEKINPEIAHKSRYPYAAVAEMTYGEGVSRLVTFVLDLTVFGAGIPNLLLASQNLQMIGLRASNWGFDFSFCYWMLLLGLLMCPIMWLGSPKDLKWVALSSALTVLSVAVLTWSILLRAESSDTPLPTYPSWENVAIAYGILAFQFDIHPVILTVQVDMADKKKLGQAILSAFTVSGSLFLVTCVLAILRLGVEARPNILQGLPRSNALLADELLVTLQICLSMVVSGTALFQDVEHNLGIPKHFTWRRCVVRSVVILLSVVLGEAVPRFDLVMGLLGGALTGPLMFILPPVLYARLRAMQPQPNMTLRSGLVDFRTCLANRDGYGTFDFHSDPFDDSPLLKDELFPMTKGNPLWNSLHHFRNRMLALVSVENNSEIGPLTFWEKVWTVCLVAGGAVTTTVCTYYTLRDTVRYARFAPPCISNVTVASWAVIDDRF